MQTPHNISNLIKRTRQYEFADGLRDLQLAVVFISLGVTSWWIFDYLYLPHTIRLLKGLGRAALWLNLLLVFLPAILGLIMLGVIGYIRKRWLWRNSGMVKSKPLAAPTWVTITATAIYVLSIVFAYIFQRSNTLFLLQMIVVAAGWSTGITLVGLGFSIGLKRYIWLGLLGGLASTIFLFLKLTFGETALAFGIAWGVLFAVVGIVLLRHAIMQAKGGANG